MEGSIVLKMGKEIAADHYDETERKRGREIVGGD